MSHTLDVHYEDRKEPNPTTLTPDPHQDAFSKVTLGFWIYLMTDCLLFGTLFLTYALFHSVTFGGPSSQEIFSLQTAFMETMILLFSSAACGFAVMSSIERNFTKTTIWLGVVFLLGALFLLSELTEFYHLVQEGHSWTRSAFLSSYFTLVGMHGAHIFVGLLWCLVLAAQMFYFGITVDTFRRLVVFSLFWHFLDLIWIFIFTFVYLIGVI